MKQLLGKVLLAKRLVTEAQLAQGLQAQADDGGRLGSILVELGHLPEPGLADALSEQHGLPAVDREILVACSGKLPPVLTPEQIEQYLAIPIGVDGAKLLVAMVDPSDPVAVEGVRDATGMELELGVLPEWLFWDFGEGSLGLIRSGFRRTARRNLTPEQVAKREADAQLPPAWAGRGPAVESDDEGAPAFELPADLLADLQASSDLFGGPSQPPAPVPAPARAQSQASVAYRTPAPAAATRAPAAPPAVARAAPAQARAPAPSAPPPGAPLQDDPLEVSLDELEAPRAAPPPPAAVYEEPTPLPFDEPDADPHDEPTPGPRAASIVDPHDEPTPGPTRAALRDPHDEPTPGPDNALPTDPHDEPTPGPDNAALVDPHDEPTPGPRDAALVDPADEPTPGPRDALPPVLEEEPAPPVHEAADPPDDEEHDVDLSMGDDVQEPAEPGERKTPFSQILDELALAEGRDDIVEVLRRYARGRTARMVLFYLRKEAAHGFACEGQGLVHEQVLKLAVPLVLPSALLRALETRLPYIGPPIAGVPADVFHRWLGEPIPTELMVIPIRVGNKVVNLLYLDNAFEPLPPAIQLDSLRLSKACASAYERMIGPAKPEQG